MAGAGKHIRRRPWSSSRLLREGCKVDQTHGQHVWESLVDCPMDLCARENRCFSGWTTDFAARGLIPGFSEHHTKHHRVWPSKTKTAHKKTNLITKLEAEHRDRKNPQWLVLTWELEVLGKAVIS